MSSMLPRHHLVLAQPLLRKMLDSGTPPFRKFDQSVPFVRRQKSDREGSALEHRDKSTTAFTSNRFTDGTAPIRFNSVIVSPERHVVLKRLGQCLVGGLGVISHGRAKLKRPLSTFPLNFRFLNALGL